MNGLRSASGEAPDPLGRVLESGLATVVFLAPMPFGSVVPTGRLALEMAALLLFVIWLVRAARRESPPPGRLTLIGLTGLINGCLIRGGTEKRSPSELAMALDENAIHLTVSVGEESAVVALSLMKEDWNKGLEILKEVLTQPGFDS